MMLIKKYKVYKKLKRLNTYILESYMTYDRIGTPEGKYDSWEKNSYFRNFLLHHDDDFIYDIIDKEGNHNKKAEDDLKKYVNTNIRKLFTKFEDKISDYSVDQYDYKIHGKPEMQLDYYEYVYNEQKDEYCICSGIKYNLSWTSFKSSKEHSFYVVDLYIKFDKDFNVEDLELKRDCDYYFNDRSSLYKEQIKELKQLFKKEHNIISLYEYIHDNMLNSESIPDEYVLSNFLAGRV